MDAIHLFMAETVLRAREVAGYYSVDLSQRDKFTVSKYPGHEVARILVDTY